MFSPAHRPLESARKLVQTIFWCVSTVLALFWYLKLGTVIQTYGKQDFRSHYRVAFSEAQLLHHFKSWLS